MFRKSKYFIPAAVALVLYIYMRSQFICSLCRERSIWFCSSGVYIDLFFIFYVIPFLVVLYIIIWIRHYRKWKNSQETF